MVEHRWNGGTRGSHSLFPNKIRKNQIKKEPFVVITYEKT